MSIPSHVVRTKSDEAAIDQGCTFDQGRADRVKDFISSYHYLDTTGRPLTVLPWMAELIDGVYGWVRPDKERRRINKALLSVGRKNAKTELAAALTGYHLLADGCVSPKCVSLAVDRKQAGQIFDKVNFSIEVCPKLRACLHSTPSQKLVTYPQGHGTYQALSSDAKGSGKMGHGTSFAVIDELAFHRSDHLYTAIEASGQGIPNSLQLITSTAGWDFNGVFYRLVEYSRKVISGEVIDVGFMPFLYEVPNLEAADLESPTTWRLANPSLDLGPIRSDEFREKWDRAKQAGPAEKLNFTRLHFNSWTQSERGWLDLAKWDTLGQPLPDLKGRPIFLGLDAGGLTDLTALVGVVVADGVYHVLSWAFVPDQAISTRDGRNLVNYQTFKRAGELELVPGNSVSQADNLHPLLDRIAKEYDVQSLTIDRWQLNALAETYQRKGWTVYRFVQSHRNFTDPCKSLERLVGEGKLRHGANGLLRWQAGHVQLDRDKGGYVKPSKANDSQKIDSLVALLMALSQATLPPEDKPKWSKPAPVEWY